MSRVSLILVMCCGTFGIKEVCSSVFYLLFHFKDLDFLHLSALVPVYKGPSIVFSLHPVGFFFLVFLQG